MRRTTDTLLPTINRRFAEFDRRAADLPLPKAYGAVPPHGVGMNSIPLLSGSPEVLRNRLLELVVTLVAGACLVVLMVGSLP